MKIPLLSIACSLCLLAPAAQAQVHAVAQLSHVSYQLVDLDLHDGITPELQFSSLLSGTSHLNLGDFSQPDQDWHRFQHYDVLEPNVQQFGNYIGNVSTRFDGGYLSSHFATGSAQNGYMSAYSMQINTFTLTANTQLLIFGDVDGSAHAENGEVSWAGAHGQAFAYLQDDTSKVARHFYHLSADAAHPDVASSEHFVLSLNNDQGFTRSGYLGLGVSADGYFVASSVPEPSSYALIGAGLLALVGAARRRRR